MVNDNFCSEKPFFGPKFGHFCSKIRFSDIFFESAHQICLKLGQKLGTNALNHRMAVLCLGKFLFGCFGHFWVKNTLLVVTLYGFWLKNCLLSLYLRNRASDFDDFLHKATSWWVQKMFQADFWKKFSFGRFWPKAANFCHFWPF